MALRKVITERKQAEERARRREEQLEVLLQISRDLNRDLDQSVVLRKVVLAALKLTGAPCGAAGVMEQGKVRFAECHREGAWHPMVVEFEPGEGVPGTVIESRLPYRSEGKPGVGLESEPAPLESDFAWGACIPILDWDGRSLGCLGIQGPSSGAGITEEDVALLMGLGNAASVALVNARDIAQRETHRRAMEHTQKLESLGVQAGGIAHDFNNLLSAIAGNVALAQLHEEDGQAAHYLENVNTTIQRAADLTHQLLAYAGRGRSERKHVQLHTLVGGMVKLLKVSVSKMARIHLDLPSHLPTILAVPSELQQVVMNLVINASDALGEKEGDIFLTTRLAEQEQLPSKLDAEGRTIPLGTYVCLEIRDTGCGMPTEVQARIFDPFFTTKSTGRGLGLSAILGILRHHNAWIQLESAPGRGTTFTLLFSAASGPAEMQEEGRMEPCWMGHGRVLLADDEVDVRQSTADLLRRFGFEVVEARDGAEAMSLFAAGPPFQLVLTDLTMPQMDGLELARLLRRLAPEVKVVIYSGLPFELNSAAMADLSGQLLKPFKWQELNQLMKRLLAPSDEP
ncbi:MAG: response regulator [Acidobacteria bacterium]|nr:response regulator [Acidobacteriota bacterium]